MTTFTDPYGLFEIKHIDGKGLAMVATEFIPKRVMIFCEKPLIKTPPGWSEELADKQAYLHVLGADNQQQFRSVHDFCRCPSQQSCNESQLQRIWQTNAFEVNFEGQRSREAVYTLASRLMLRMPTSIHPKPQHRVDSKRRHRRR